MNFILERITSPAIEPVDLATAKLHLRTYASDTAEDDLISGLIKSAREWAEHFTGRALVDQAWRITIDRRIGNAPGRNSTPSPSPENGYGWASGEFSESLIGWPLRKSPVIAITAFNSIDGEGTETAMDTNTYFLGEPNSRWPRIVPVNSGLWTGDVFNITYRAGFAAGLGSPDPTPDTDDVPQRFKQAIKLYAEALYDRDEKMMPLLMEAAENILRPERVELGIA